MVRVILVGLFEKALPPGDIDTPNQTRNPRRVDPTSQPPAIKRYLCYLSSLSQQFEKGERPRIAGAQLNHGLYRLVKIEIIATVPAAMLPVYDPHFPTPVAAPPTIDHLYKIYVFSTHMCTYMYVLGIYESVTDCSLWFLSFDLLILITATCGAAYKIYGAFIALASPLEGLEMEIYI